MTIEWDSYDANGCWDDMMAAAGRPRDAAGTVARFLASLSIAEIQARQKAAEADDPTREAMRRDMGEAYRTLLGHCRHEIGHYYWDVLVRDGNRLDAFRARFGDERAEYEQARERHYASGPPPDWPARHVSAYASMHPWEDWAETFAHYLHMVDTLETARSHGLALRPPTVDGASLPAVTARRLHFDDFDDLVTAWVPLTVALNSFNRGMGLPDLYPFVLSEAAVRKLQLVHDIVEDAGHAPA